MVFYKICAEFDLGGINKMVLNLIGIPTDIIAHPNLLGGTKLILPPKLTTVNSTSDFSHDYLLFHKEMIEVCLGVIKNLGKINFLL